MAVRKADIRAHGRPGPVLLAAFCLLAALPATAVADSCLTPVDQEFEQEYEQEEIQQFYREIERLSGDLQEAVDTIESGRRELDAVKEALRRLEEDLSELDESPDTLRLKAQLTELRGRYMSANLRRAMGGMPDARELLDDELWRRFAPDIEVMRGTTSRHNIFRIGEDVEIGLYERVRGDVVVIGGEITVRGSVTGSVVAIFDDIHITGTGRVDGDAVTIGGMIRQDPGGTVRGDFVDTRFSWPQSWHWIQAPALPFFFGLGGFVFILLVSLMVGLIAPRGVDRVEYTVRNRFGASFLVGLLTELLLPIVFILLLITIIGIPVAIIVVPLAMAWLLILGFTGVARAVGRGADQRGLKIGDSPVGLIAVGVVLLEIIYLIGGGLGIAPGVLVPFAFANPFPGLDDRPGGGSDDPLRHPHPRRDPGRTQTGASPRRSRNSGLSPV